MDVTDNGSPAESVLAGKVVKVIETTPVLSSTVDSDGDGVSDADEGYGDHDGDGIPDCEDAIDAVNVLQGAAGSQDLFLIETKPGVPIRLGEVAFADGDGAAEITQDDVADYFDVPSDSVDDGYDIVGAIFDFELSGLQAAQSVNVVIPLPEAIPADAVYRKYTVETGWYDFVIDENNRVSSASGALGACPPPGDGAYTEGLTEGHYCVQLTLEDGGPNDADLVINGVIKDPGGVKVQVGSGSTGSNNRFGCFIAPAAYGSPLASQVRILRDLRDRVLIKSTAGRYLVGLYYTCSPPIADYIGAREYLRAVVRWCLLPVVGMSWIVLHLGIIPALILPMILTLAVLRLIRLGRRYKIVSSNWRRRVCGGGEKFDQRGSIRTARTPWGDTFSRRTLPP